MTCDNVVVLDVAWGPWERGSRWFRINPGNFTGRRLYAAFGDERFVVTNACPQMVSGPDERGTPSDTWLRRNLELLAPRFVLVCGRVAQSTFEDGMVDPRCVVLRRPHPAARTWTRVQLMELAHDVRTAARQARSAFEPTQ